MTSSLEADAAVRIADLPVPFSDFASAAAKNEFAKMRMQSPPYYAALAGPDVEVIRRLWDEHETMPALEMARKRFPVHIESATIGGVGAEVVTPATGVLPENENRILINLHGGGFIAGAHARALLEAVPIASVAGMKVVTLDYRLSPEHIFPAASEDIAAAYRALLKDYKPDQIGIYGCSAGGTLSAEAVAWFDKEGLPQPGGIGMICSNAARMGAGDSAVIGRALGISVPPPAKLRWYFDEADPNDPLVSPCASSDLLSKFPPVLLISASRDFFLSHTTYMHLQLTKAGIDARLYVWDGLWHGFVWTPDLPESQEAFAVIAKFFDSCLSR